MSLTPSKSEARRSYRQGRFEPWLAWRRDVFRTLTCPACETTGVMEKQLDASPPFMPKERVSLFACGACGSLHYPDCEPFEYHGQRDADLGRKFYVEIGAGLDAMVAPLHWVPAEAGTRYLEVGGGYGFALDYAVRGLGWRGIGMDPSDNARAGAKDLGIEVRHELLTAEAPPPDGPFDRILASEVIEHVPDPDPFLAAIAAALAPDGVALITTPDAKAVEQGAPEAVLRPVLAPKHHLVLFTEAGLRAALERAGFTHIVIAERDSALCAVASRRPVEPDFGARPPAQNLANWLGSRRDALAADPLLTGGFAWRLLKARINDGDNPAAVNAAAYLEDSLRGDYGIDPDRPDRIEPRFDPPQHRERTALRRFARHYPFHLPLALYYLGREREILKDVEGAIALYAACIRLTPVIVRALQAIFAVCRETETTALRAHLQIARLCAATRPADAVRHILAVAPEAARLDAQSWREARLRVFADASLTGGHEEAEALVPDAAFLLEETPAEARDALDALALAALAQRAERRGRAMQAARFFREAAQAAGPRESAGFTRQADQAEGRALADAMARGATAEAETPARALAGRGPDSVALDASSANAMGLYLLIAGMEGQRAAAWFERALDLSGEAADAEMRGHYALALAGDGREDEARAAAAALDPNALSGSLREAISRYLPVSG
jgi:SAM-dependent methyltransferase